MMGKPSPKSTQPHGAQTSYRERTMSYPWCDKCNMEIYGNGSVGDPYQCDCSQYDFDHDTYGYDKRVPLKVTPTP